MAATVFKMDAEKNLIMTARATLYQHEKNVDSIAFLLPQHYDGMDLGDFKVEMRYADFSNALHSDELEKDEELCQEKYYRYVFPVTEEFTQAVGNISVWLALSKKGAEEGDEGCVMYTSTAEIPVLHRPDYRPFEKEG